MSRKRREEERKGTDSVLQEAADVKIADVPDVTYVPDIPEVADGSFPYVSTQSQSEPWSMVISSKHKFQWPVQQDTPLNTI